MNTKRSSFPKWLLLTIATLSYTVLSLITADILIAQNSFRPAIALLAVFAAIEGPLFGFIVGFIGNVGVDWFEGSFWWHWSVGNGIIGLIIGLLYLVPGYHPRKGEITFAHYVMFMILSAVGNYVGLILASLVDVWLNQVDFISAVFQWAFTPATVNVLMIGTLGVGGLYLYARMKKHK
ncbi:ECF transporter S component [Brevibacillus sp. SYSU BS000544]|uniref:ECF transporter S component n=1 Tax=Brevibacillus sp. SYSU BS000544 TaxID=3416443 RepID=UPI003CE49800